MSPLAHALAAALYAAEGRPVSGRALARRLRCSQAALESETTTGTTLRRWLSLLREQGVEVRIDGRHTADGATWRVTAAASPTGVHKE